MKKRWLALLTGTLLTGTLMLPLTACGNGNDTPGGESNTTLTETGIQVSWDKVSGAAQYAVYHSPSRFGEYSLESTQSSRIYKSNDRYGYYRVDALDQNGATISSDTYSFDFDTFGENTHIYAETDDRDAIWQDIEEFRSTTGQFGKGRFAALFKQGDYRELDLAMRYYMTFSGLGTHPTEVQLGGFNTYGELSGGNSTCNFWCGIENMTVDSNVQWAVSQATSFRRMQVNGNLTLHHQGGKTPWASGGFLADTVVTGTIDGSVQQQWFTRNSDWNKWSGGDINTVFAGCSGTLSNYNWGQTSNGWVTYLEKTNVMREKPYLIFDNGYYVCRPELKTDSKGVSWLQENENDDYIPLNQFYVARADRDNAKTLNAALQKGKHLLFTPGIYQIDSPLLVTQPDTIVMGIGLASLKVTAKNTDTLMRIADVDGVQVSGIIFDAGPSTKTLMQVGTDKTDVRHRENPIVLSDVYFRIGGAEEGNTSVDVTLEINANDVVGDNFWVWRGDHSHGVGWNVNRTKNGVIVNGDHVTIYGLMVEHFHEYQTIWNGEYGFMAFYQSETPYDVDDLEEWTSHWMGQSYKGYASYKVADHVQNHTAYGLGVYYVARKGNDENPRTFTLDHAIELPSNAGIRVEHMGIANFATFGDKKTNGGITHIVNDRGDSLYVADGHKNHFESFIGGVYKK